MEGLVSAMRAALDSVLDQEPNLDLGASEKREAILIDLIRRQPILRCVHSSSVFLGAG